MQESINLNFSPPPTPGVKLTTETIEKWILIFCKKQRNETIGIVNLLITNS